ncbi:MAG: DEAD/DEAH box helicase [Opitutaceae bacterium]|nr:DEAD/DEAH box helicase [Opitutaceae bacterium]
MSAFDGISATLRIPDLWQQDAVRALDAGRDVVVSAPTGAGKTHIFELLVERGWRRQAVYTVPTRALANDKLAEWRARGWNVGIATGDVAENLNAPVVVATLETQKSRFLQRTGPALLVIDEYQLLADPIRGTNYELAIALAPRTTQLLLLSGSVGNPADLQAWLARLGRDAVLVHHPQRPVPQEEVWLEALTDRVPEVVRGFWPRMIARALLANLGPVLVFAPQRKAAEQMARHLSAALPVLDPLVLTREQEQLAGDRLAKLLKTRIAFHHSGLSYAQRAGLVEPLAKAGQLRAVVATTGLAAGINFSMRSVLVTETEYTVGSLQRLIRPDELLQMFGRAGRRGLDEVGYVLVAPDRPRLAEARPLHVRRAATVEWPGLIAVMHAAVKSGDDPMAAAVALCGRLFSPQSVPLGVEHCLGTGPQRCGLMIDAARARRAHPEVAEMRNSRGLWEPQPPASRVPLDQALVWAGGRWRPALSQADVLRTHGSGQLCLLGRGRERRYGREVQLAVRDRRDPAVLAPVKPVRRALAGVMAEGPRSVVPHVVDDAGLRARVLPLLPALSGGGRLLELVERGGLVVARVDYGHIEIDVYRDGHGAALIAPETRKAYPAECQGCPQLGVCEGELRRARSPAFAWLQLGLVDGRGVPTRRGQLFSLFHNGEGLAVAAALEDETYDVDVLLADLANLRAGHRFEEHAGKSTRLGVACRGAFGDATHEGYLERGLPPHYGDGAAEVLALTASGRPPDGLYSSELRPGDVERARLEWHSLLRHIMHAPALDWPRWTLLQEAAARYVSGHHLRSMLGDLPPLTPAQTRRVDHRLRFG